MNMIEAMTGAPNAQDEVVEERYEKSRAFIGGLAGVVAGGVAGLVLGGISGALIDRKPKMALSFDSDDEYVCDEKLLTERVSE